MYLFIKKRGHKMKSYVVALFGLSFVCFANAQSNSIPGGMTRTVLGCKSEHHFEGVKLGIIIESQSVAQEFAIRGVYVTETDVYPGAPTYITKIELEKQDMHRAVFNFENKYNVVLNKHNFDAQLVFENTYHYSCKEEKSNF